MIRSLKLTNFMRHENLDVAFGPGLQVLRGANEAGKSSVLLGVAYCLFGAKALRTTLAEAVTWGKPESSLKVSLIMDVAGRSLTITRAKGGAEITEGGKVLVTGQTEVSGYVASLIGADAQAATRLMLANQGNLRGSLEQGPKATAQMIEGLADFDLFERLIEAMTEKLALGNTDAAEAAVKVAEENLAAAPMPAQPDLTFLDAQIAVNSAEIAGTERESTELFKVLQDVEARVKILSDGLAARSNLEKQANTARANLDSLQAQAAALKAQAVCSITAEAVEEKRTAIAAAKDDERVRAAWSQFKTLEYPAEYWEGPRDEFDATRKNRVSQLELLRNKVSTLEGDIRVLNSTLITSSVCGFCHKDFSQFPDVAKKNAETAQVIAGRQHDLAAAKVELAELSAEVNALDSVNKKASTLQAQMLKLNDYVRLDENFWPPRFAWSGPAVADVVPDVKALEAALAEMVAEVKSAEAAKSKLEVVSQSIAAAEANIKELAGSLQELVTYTPEIVAEAETEKVRATEAWRQVYEKYSRAVLTRAELARQREDAEKGYAAAVAAHEKATTDLTRSRHTLDDMRFNNALLKKVRAARPIIADKLWNTVLSAVSTMFSRMRGEVSVVTKGKDGFTVNGQAVESLSGSTLDLLGLAIRTALIKTFIPQCPFLVLDEPGAAMDSDRVTAMLGFVHATGFNQVLLVTHDSIAETVADNVVQL